MMNSIFRGGSEITARENFNTDVPKFSKIDDNQLEQVGADNFDIPEFSATIEQVQTINEKYEGQSHPDTGIVYERKVIEHNGEIREGVFPQFDSACDVKLPEDLIISSDRQQFTYCNSELKTAYEDGKLNTSDFSNRQLEQIKNGDKPQGFTWHHNEERGMMNLVNTEIHDGTRHTGGKVIWGGGQDAR